MSIKPFTFDDVFIGRNSERARLFVDAQWDGERLSLTGTMTEFGAHGAYGAYSVGQITDEVREILPRLADLWDRWHLNDMRAGCEHQEAAFRDGTAVRPTWKNDYAGMDVPCTECGYKYGSAWNTETVPNDVLTEIRTILTDPLLHRV